jgi:hypothetical protein
MSETAFLYQLGLQARDPISDFEGIIVSRVHYLFGCSQYGLAPKKGADGSVQKTEYFDEARIEILGLGVLPEGSEDINEFKDIFMHEAGKQAVDKVTGFKGTIAYRLEYMHGSNQYGIIPTVDKDGKTGDSEQFDEGRMEIIGEGIKPKDVQAPKRGGINRDAPRF